MISFRRAPKHRDGTALGGEGWAKKSQEEGDSHGDPKTTTRLIHGPQGLTGLGGGDCVPAAETDDQRSRRRQRDVAVLGRKMHALASRRRLLLVPQSAPWGHQRVKARVYGL